MRTPIRVRGNFLAFTEVCFIKSIIVKYTGKLQPQLVKPTKMRVKVVGQVTICHFWPYSAPYLLKIVLLTFFKMGPRVDFEKHWFLIIQV